MLGLHLHNERNIAGARERARGLIDALSMRPSGLASAAGPEHLRLVLGACISPPSRKTPTHLKPSGTLEAREGIRGVLAAMEGVGQAGRGGLDLN